jgi:methyl-accepting chemotaxis protein
MIVRLEENLERLSDRLVAVLERGEKLLSDENLKNFSSLLENANKVAAKGTDVEEKMISSLEEAQSTLGEFRVSFAKLSKDYSALAADLNSSLTPSLRNFETMSQSIETLALKIEKTVNRGDYNMQKIMQPTLNDMRRLSAQIDELARGLKASPSDILYKSNTPRKGPGE